MSYVKTLFTYVPFAVFAVTFFLFVWRSGFGRFGMSAWTVWLLFCCSKFLAFWKLGGNVFVPDLPEKVIWFWNWAYSGSMILGGLSVVFFFKFRNRKLALPLVAWLLASWGFWSGVKVPDVHEIEMPFTDLPAELDGYRIVQLSDLHASSAARRWRTQAIVDKVNALGADLVCLTGDYVDGECSKYGDVLEPIADLRGKDGVWAVTGNHEWFDWQRGWWAWYERHGIRFLGNECVFPRRSLALGGLHDFGLRRRKSAAAYPDVAQTFAAATNGEFRILLQHQPRMAHANLSAHGVRLQLSGHTHGGIMPILSLLVGRANDGFVRGAYWIGNSALYVNPGCGQWAGFPMRFFDPAEIAVITLRKKVGT